MMSWPWPTDASSNMSSATVAAFSEEMQPLGGNGSWKYISESLGGVGVRTSLMSLCSHVSLANCSVPPQVHFHDYVCTQLHT